MFSNFRLRRLTGKPIAANSEAVCGRKRTTSLRAPTSATLKANMTSTIAVQRDERRVFCRFNFRRWRRAAKVSMSSPSGSACGVFAQRRLFDRRHQRGRVGDRDRFGSQPARSVSRSKCSISTEPGLDWAAIRLRHPADRILNARRQNRRLPAARRTAPGGRRHEIRLDDAGRLRFGFRDHAVDKRGDFRRGFRAAGEPGRLAAGTAHRTSGRPDRGRIDHVGRGAVRTDDQHGIYGDLGRQ